MIWSTYSSSLAKLVGVLKMSDEADVITYVTEHGTVPVRNTLSLEVALAAIIAAVYAVGTVMLAPVSFLAIQVRLTDCLIPLAFYLRRPAVAGVTIGNVVANLFSPFGFIDIIIGTVANFLAAASCMYAPKWYVSGLSASAIVAMMVGTELAFFYGTDLWVMLVISVWIGSLISMVLIGNVLLAAVKKAFPFEIQLFRKWR